MIDRFIEYWGYLYWLPRMGRLSAKDRILWRLTRPIERWRWKRMTAKALERRRGVS